MKKRGLNRIAIVIFCISAVSTQAQITADELLGWWTADAQAAVAEGDGETLFSVADAFVRGGTYSDDNYGSEATLEIKDHADKYDRQAYLRFDLLAVSGPISSAILRLKLISGVGSDSHTAYFVSDDSWGESTLTYGNKPAGSTALDSATLPPAIGSWLELDVTDQVGTEAAADQIFSVVIISDSGARVYYHSQEAASEEDHPQLMINGGAAAPIEPYDAWATTYGGADLIGAATHDFDGDGLANLLEFAFGGDPKDGNDGKLIRSAATLVEHNGTNAFAYSFRRLTDRRLNGLEYRVEVTDDLTSGSWNLYSNSLAVADLESDSDIEVVTATIDLSLFPNYFVRLNVWALTQEDNIPPTPNPATWAADPSAISPTAITMDATAASDRNDIEYLFINDTLGTSSAWLSSPVYTQTGLSPETEYAYRVRSRDVVGNEGTFGAAKSATTLEAGIHTTYYIDNQADFDAYASYAFAPGDEILFERGVIFSGMFAPKGSGEPGQPIVIGNYGTGPIPIINAMGSNEAGILLKNVEQWEIDGIEITNTDGTQDHQGKLKGIYVLIDNPIRTVMNHIRISNCYIHDVNGVTKDDDPYGAKRHGGIHIHTYGDSACRLNDVEIVGNTVENTGGVGIANDSTHVAIKSVTADRTYLWTDVHVAHNFVDNTDRNNMIIRDSINPLVEYNVLANSSRENTGHNLFNFDTVGFVAQYNEGYGNLGDGGDRGAYDADYNNIDTTFQYNYSHDNQWMIGIMNKFNEGVTIRYNISQNDRSGFIFYGFNIAFQSRDIKVYNNTYFAGEHLSSGRIVAHNSVAKRTTFYNNIFYFENGASHGDKVGDWEDIIFSHNAYIGIVPWDGEVGAVTSNLLLANPGTGGADIDMSDPNRLLGYRLQPGSACIDAGISIPGVIRDFWGNLVPAGSAADIGAHEVQP